MKSNTPDYGYRWTKPEMRDMLRRGDYVRLTEITGFSLDYIMKITKEERDSSFVWMIIHKYLLQREQLQAEARSIRELELLPEKY